MKEIKGTSIHKPIKKYRKDVRKKEFTKERTSEDKYINNERNETQP